MLDLVATSRPRLVTACIEDLATFRALKHDWEALYDRCPDATPFTSWEWLFSWWQAYRTSRKLRLLTWRNDGTLVAVVPLYLNVERTILGAKCRVLRLLGDGTFDSDYLGCLAHPGMTDQVRSEFAAWLKASPEWDVLVLRELTENCALQQLLEDQYNRLGCRLRLDFGRTAVLDLPRSIDDLLRSRQARFRTKLRALLRKLDEGALTLETHCEPSQLRRRLRSFFALHQKRWREAGESGVFGAAPKRLFYAHFVTRFARNGWLRLYSLRDGDRYVAHQLCFERHRTTYLLQEGFDTSNPTASYGQMLRVAVMKHLIETGGARYDFLGGFSKHKEGWGATEGRSVHLTLARGTWRGRLYATEPLIRERLARVTRPLRFSKVIRLASSRGHASRLHALREGGTGHPPVFVMNPYYSAIGVARSLHGHRVKVYALASEREAPGLRSRYFAGQFDVPNGRDEPEQLCEELLRLGRAQPERPVLFPTRDFDVLFLHRYRERLKASYLLPQAEDSPILQMMDKFHLASVALDLGMAAPATWLCRSAEELEQHIPTLPFPVVLKPRFAHQWRGKGIWNKVGAQKAFIAESVDQLRAHYQRVGSVTNEVLVQEYVQGGDTEIVVCCCYVGRDGDLAGHFTGRKLRQDPPSIGTGYVVEATDVPTIIAPSRKLLSALGYRGMAEIEYKHDQRTGQFCLIEINPRHWDQHELGTLVGVNLTWIAYRDIVGLPLVRTTPVYEATAKYKWIAENELAFGILRTVRQELGALARTNAPLRTRLGVLTRMWHDVAVLLAGRRLCAVMRWRDPIPGVLLSLRLIGEGLRRLVASLIPHRRDALPSGAPNDIWRSTHHG